ncbi:MAG TPA: hypothetical protein VGV60_09840 [Candidatus Polarisedimenticolia bacterium]|jgi:hypothetical protein|nr:hypothetical protein [Candidatus Polarisedimenticolia bacterium]
MMRPAGAAAMLALLAMAAPVRQAASQEVVPLPPLAEAAPPGMVRRQVGLCTLEGPADLLPLLDRLADQAEAGLQRVEAELGTGAAAPYRIVLIPRVLPTAGAPSGPRSSTVPGSSAAARLRELDRLAPEWASGFLLPSRRLGAIRLAEADRYPHADLGSVLAHEATHMILFDAAGNNLPRWFGEGVATGIERSWGMRDVLVFSSSLLTGRLPPLAELDAAFDASDDRARAAYAASFDFMLFTVKRYGDGVVREIVREAASRPFPEAWRAATGVSLERSETEWRRGSLFLYRWIPALTGTTALWSGITLLALFAGAHRRARSRAILERWEAEERPPVPPDDDEVVH